MTAKQTFAETQQFVFFIVADPLVFVVANCKQKHRELPHAVSVQGFRIEAHTVLRSGPPFWKEPIQSSFLNPNSASDQLKQSLDKIASLIFDDNEEELDVIKVLVSDRLLRFCNHPMFQWGN